MYIDHVLQRYFEFKPPNLAKAFIIRLHILFESTLSIYKKIEECYDVRLLLLSVTVLTVDFGCINL